jgi:3-hydroxy acid dehydrogenase/malonic semialdehyde reductase
MKKIVFVTGATAGLGLAIAELLAENGFNLILNGRRAERLAHLSTDLEKRYGIKTCCVAFDVRIREDVEYAIRNLPPEWKEIDILINNAGLALGLSGIEAGDPGDWDTMIDTNLKGLLYVSRNVMPGMVERQKGHIVNVGSIAGKEIYANGNVYCASKAAVDSLSRSMRLDLSKYGIRVSAIHPGAVETEFSVVRFKGDEQRAKAVYQGFENLVARDVAEAVWFILNRPPHVNINEMTIMPTAQPMAGVIHRK